MAEQPGTGPELSADPAAEQGAVPLPKEDGQEGITSKGIEENACAPGAGVLLNGRFQLVECVGVGGMSTVYKALDRHAAPERAIAVKVLNPRFQADPQRLAALQREVGSCQQLVHPNIVRVYEFHRDGSTAYLTMEYLHGEPLTARIRSESFTGMSAPEALPIINAVGQALAYAHSRGIVHCDFKPANVFLTEAGKIKLIDFGMARAFVPHEGEESPPLVEAISPAYASAQMLEGQEPDPRDDVYGLACTAYELLTGAHPFRYRSAIEARRAGLTVERYQELNYRQWQALCAALVFDRGERTPSVKAFLKEFNEESWRVKPLHLAAGAAACLLVAIGGVIGLLSSQPEPGPIAPSEGSARPEAMSEALQPGPATDPLAEIASIEAWPPPAIALDHADVPSQPGPATDPLAEIASIEARPPPAIALDHADVIAPLLEQTSGIGTLPSRAIKPEAKVTVSSSPSPPVAALLDRAERQMATKRLTTPVGDAALESYEQVLKLVPGHEGALEGIARIKDEYKLWAGDDKRRGSWKRAEASLKKALAIDPEDAVLAVALHELREARKRAEQEGARGGREQKPHQLTRLEIVRPKEEQVNVRSLTTLNRAGGEIIITEQECPNDPQGSFAVSTAVNQAIRHTGCAVRLDQDRLAIEWNNGTVSAHSITEFAPSEAVLGARSSPDDARSEDPVARPVSRFEEFERRMGIRR
ncbi:MAG: protein kinase domain-containing protein [Gammaproteobacteria bacterium]